MHLVNNAERYKTRAHVYLLNLHNCGCCLIHYLIVYWSNGTLKTSVVIYEVSQSRESIKGFQTVHRGVSQALVGVSHSLLPTHRQQDKAGHLQVVVGGLAMWADIMHNSWVL